MASSTPKKYDVFLNFQGQDIRNNFLGHLYEDLCRNKIAAFMDEELRGGDELSPTLLKAIEESKIALVILSQTYAESPWCLDELLKILQCKDRLDQTVVPVFYHVASADVAGPAGSFKVALEGHKTRFGTDKVDHWTFALKRVANFKGWPVHKDKPETELIKAISKDILEQLNGVVTPIDAEQVAKTQKTQKSNSSSSNSYNNISHSSYNNESRSYYNNNNNNNGGGSSNNNNNNNNNGGGSNNNNNNNNNNGGGNNNNNNNSGSNNNNNNNNNGGGSNNNNNNKQ